MKIRKVLTTVCALALMVAQLAQAATLTWDSTAGGVINDGGGAWLGVGQWNNGAPSATWTSGDDAIFGNGGVGGAVTLASPGTAANSLTFNTFITTGYTLGSSGNTLTLTNGITKNASSGLVTIISPITLGGSQTWTNNSVNKLQINSFVSTSPGQILTLAGTGEINFPTTTTGITGDGSIIVDGVYLNLISGGNQANNTYTGTTTVQNGGEILYYQTGPNIGTGNITLNGGILAGYYNQGFTRPLGAGNGQFQITGGESGFGVNGANTINFSNTNEVKWGDATFNPSKFVLGGGRSGGTVTFAENIDLNNANRTVTTPVGGVLSGVIRTSTGTAGLIKEGAGTLALSGNNTFNGGTTISQGTLRFDTRASMPAAGTVAVGSGATLGVTVAGTATTWGGGTGVAGIAGLTSTANSGEGYGGQTGALVNFDGNSFLNLNVTGNVTESNAIGDGTATSIRLIKSGASTLTLSGNNTYSGGTTLSAGALAVGSANALSSGTLFLNGGTIQSSDATACTLTNAVTIGGDFTVGGTGNLTFSNTGAVALGAARTITVNTGITATFDQSFSGNQINKLGAGTLVLSGNNSGFAGKTILNSGGGAMIFKSTTALNTAIMSCNSGIGAFQIQSDSGFSIANGFQAYGSGTLNLVLDRQIPGSGTGLIYQFTGANSANDVAATASLNFSAGSNVNLGTTSTVTYTQGIRSQSNNAGSNIINIDASGVNVRINGLTCGGSGKNRNWVLKGSSTGNEVYGGILANGTISLTKDGTGTWTLSSNANTYSGATTISAGTLALGAHNALPSATAVSIGNGMLDAATFTNKTVGTLTITAVTGNATINLGSASSALAFADSSGTTWSAGKLQITGTFVPGYSLRFGTTSDGLSATQLTKISAPGGRPVKLDSNGYLRLGGGTVITLI